MLVKTQNSAADIEKNRIESIRYKQERKIIQQFGVFVLRSTVPDIIQRVEELALTYQLEPILGLIDGYIEQFSNVLADVFIDTAQHETDVFLNKFGVITKTAQFDVTQREVNEFLTTSRTNFIRNLTRQQRSAIQQAVFTGIQQGKSPQQIARSFEHAIGLTPQQERMVASYANALEQGNRAALTRELRDQRYDERVLTAIEENDHIPIKTMDRMIGAYARNLRHHRALMIAQTESLRMVSRARDAAIKQAATVAGVDRSAGTKTWNTILDGRERESHHHMDGQTVGIDEPFVSPSGARLLYPGDTSMGAPASEIINCRCSVTYEFGE